MSQENVEMHHQANDAFNRRDLDAFLAICDPEIEFTSRLIEVQGGDPYHGHDGLRSWWDDLLGVSPDFNSEIEEVRDLGDVTLARHRNHGHGLGSDAPMEQTGWHVTEWRHDKAIWWRICPNEAEAVEAAGLRK